MSRLLSSDDVGDGESLEVRRIRVVLNVFAVVFGFIDVLRIVLFSVLLIGTKFILLVFSVLLVGIKFTLLDFSEWMLLSLTKNEDEDEGGPKGDIHDNVRGYGQVSKQLKHLC